MGLDNGIDIRIIMDLESESESESESEIPYIFNYATEQNVKCHFCDFDFTVAKIIL